MSTNEVTLYNELLSDKIRLQFGEINLSILRQNEDCRISVIKNGEQVPLILAICCFKNHYSKELSDICMIIKNGSFIGETFIKHGFDFIKVIKCNFKIGYPFVSDAIAEIVSGQFTDLYVSKGGIKEYVGELCEIFLTDINYQTYLIKATNDVVTKLREILSIANIDQSNLIIQNY